MQRSLGPCCLAMVGYISLDKNSGSKCCERIENPVHKEHTTYENVHCMIDHFMQQSDDLRMHSDKYLLQGKSCSSFTKPQMDGSWPRSVRSGGSGAWPAKSEVQFASVSEARRCSE